MGIVPDTRVGKIQFFQSKVSPWTTNAVAIGTTTTEVTALSTKLTAANSAIAAQVAAQQAAKTATQTAEAAVRAAAEAGAAIILQIRAKAESTHNLAVYELAQIPVPATPGPRPAPGALSKFKAELDGNGALNLTWKCVGAAGAVYQVYRSLDGSTDFAYLGGSGSKEFTDNTIPAGATQITYQIQGVRSTAVGPWATFNVFFGSNAGTTTTTLVEGPAKIAA